MNSQTYLPQWKNLCETTSLTPGCLSKLYTPGLLALVPPPKRTPDQWADEKRVLPLGSAEPGKWRSNRTPYMTAIGRAVASGLYKTVVAVMGSQMGKTEMILNIAGHRLDDDPVPILYIAPTKSFVENVFEPRYTAMVRGCASLLAKKRPGAKEKMTQKEIAGVKFRFAWAGSATELAGDPACIVSPSSLFGMEPYSVVAIIFRKCPAS